MTPMFNRFLYGGDWNPEQWDEREWARDIAMLKHAHINEVTINVFSWALLQPAEQIYDFSMLDRIVELLVAEDMTMVMATGTAALPAWLVRTHPDIIKTDADGRRHIFGGRHNACPNSPDFRRLSRALASRVAERYVGTPGLVAWHVSNEYGELCYCDQCAAAFRDWLAHRYGTVEALNHAWYANFWSHTIYDWDDVMPPVDYGDGIDGSGNKAVISGLLMDYRRFQSDSMLACYISERDAIRKYDAVTPITTNLMGAFKNLDYFEWGRAMDVISWDNYPGMDTQPSVTAMTHDLMRGVGGGKPFMLMEQTPNQQNWFPYCKVKRPGEVRKLSWQAIAHGADTVQFFQMHQSLGGCERFHGAVIGHDGTERSRTYCEVQRIGSELDRVGGKLMGGTTPARVAVMFDWDSYWSLEACVGPTQGLRYPDEVHRFYRALWRRNIAVDIIPSTTGAAALAKYAMVVAPVLIQVKPGVADALTEYVRGGGRLVTGYMTGIHDEHDLVVPGGYPGRLRELCGVWVEEIDALAPGERMPVLPLSGDAEPVAVQGCTRHYMAYAADGDDTAAAVDCNDGADVRPNRAPDGDAVEADVADDTAVGCEHGVWFGEVVASLMHLEGARPLAVYGGDEFYAGSPAVTVNKVGAGRVCYIGIPLDESGMDAVFAVMTDGLDLASVMAPSNVEIAFRQYDDGRTLMFVTNHNEYRVCVPLAGVARSQCRMVVGEAETDIGGVAGSSDCDDSSAAGRADCLTVALAPYDVAVIEVAADH